LAITPPAVIAKTIFFAKRLLSAGSQPMKAAQCAAGTSIAQNSDLNRATCLRLPKSQ
jgi:hypothetical protein